MDVINLMAATATVAAFLLAIWQYAQTRRKEMTERERVALQRERLRMAIIAAVSGAETADLIVQRSKDSTVTVAELQNIARVLRGNLGLLARQLEQEERLLGEWKFGQFYMQSQRRSDSDEASRTVS
jgi:type III secretion system FlhB-like substrate exporter